jgi:RNA polymerase subunit RPABC4/transcription elongation factor Spt4
MLNDLVGEGVIAALILAAKLGFAYIAIMWAALIYWTFRDIRRRSRDVVLQGASVLLTTLFFLPGYWLYLVLRPRLTLAEVAEEHFREALFAEYSTAGGCPRCKKFVREEYLVCPHCETTLRSACTGCSRALAASWRACPFCSQPVPRGTSSTPIPARIPAAAIAAPSTNGSAPAASPQPQAASAGSPATASSGGAGG